MPAPAKEPPLFMNRRQIALIHLAKKELGLTDDDYRAILRTHGGVDSSRDLDTAGFDRVMIRFDQLGYRSDWKTRTFGNRPGMASPGQVALIRRLWCEWSDDGDEAGMNSWLANKFACSALRFATPGIAGKAITALKAMNARKHG